MRTARCGGMAPCSSRHRGRAASSGGFIALWSSPDCTLTLENLTMSANIADNGDGGAIFVDSIARLFVTIPSRFVRSFEQPPHRTKLESGRAKRKLNTERPYSYRLCYLILFAPQQWGGSRRWRDRLSRDVG